MESIDKLSERKWKKIVKAAEEYIDGYMSEWFRNPIHWTYYCPMNLLTV